MALVENRLATLPGHLDLQPRGDEPRPAPPSANQQRTLPKGSQGDQASSDHYLPIRVDCDHCSNLSGREAAGEAGRTVLGPAPATSRNAKPLRAEAGGRSAEGARGAMASLLCNRAGDAGDGGDGEAWARRAGGFGEGSRPGGLCVSALPASHFGDGEAARLQIAGRASACSGSLAGRDGAAARRPASRGGRPHPRGPRPPSRLEAAPGPRPRPSHLPAAPLGSLAPRRAHGSEGGTPVRTPALACSPARSISRPPALRAPAPGSRAAL